MIKQPLLFVTHDLSRGLVSLVRTLAKQGIRVAVASPKSKNAKYLPDIPHIVLPGCRMGWAPFMIKSPKLTAFVRDNQPTIHTLDDLADRMMRDYDHLHHPIDFGIDLDVYHPSAVSVPRQTRFLTDYNIAPHQRMITVISPLGVKLPDLFKALKRVDRDDYLIALLGTASRFKARRISESIHENNLSGKIIFVGDERDLPSLFRTSYATLSLGHHSERMLKMALAMARPVICSTNTFGIIPNIPLEDTHPDALATALETVLDLSLAERDAFEKRNMDYAKNFCVKKTATDCLALHKNT